METIKHPHATNPALTAPLGQPLPPPPSPRRRPSPRSKPPPAVHLVAGGLGGMCGSIVTAPFDVVKTRLQSDLFRKHQPLPKASSTTATTTTRSGLRALLYNFVDTGVILRDVYKYEGPTALFKGLGPTLAGVVPGRSINFFVYGNGKLLYAEWLNDGRENTAVHLAAAASAGVVTAAATNPIWVVKTVMQLQQQQRATLASSTSTPTSSPPPPRSTSSRFSAPPPPPPSSRRIPPQPTFSHSFRSLSSPPSQLASPPRSPTSYSTAVEILRRDGFRGFYKGLSASLLGVTEGTIQWGLYEQFKKVAKRRTRDASAGRDQGGGGGGELENEGWRISVAAGAAKLVATVITYPHEVVRTRLRQPHPPAPPASRPPPPTSSSSTSSSPLPSTSSGATTTRPKYTSLVQTFRVVLAEEGWRALYGGMSPHLLRVVPNAVTMFWVYERIVGLAEKRSGTLGGAGIGQGVVRDGETEA